jgi:hypothetical protein
VRTPREMNETSLTVTVEITDLPPGCAFSASETAVVSQGGGDPIILDEFERLSVKNERNRLDTIAAEWKGKPTFYLYFFIKLAKNEK